MFIHGVYLAINGSQVEGGNHKADLIAAVAEGAAGMCEIMTGLT